MIVRILPVLLVALLARPAVAGEHPVLRLSSLGIVNRETQGAGRRINDLRVFDGKLFVGTGDYSVNTGPMAILSLDPKTGEVTREGKVDDEAIAVFCVVDGRLVIPGPDACESWELGNVYVRGDDGWTKHRTVPHGIHVFGVVSWRGRWWTATGSWVETGEKESIACGAVLSSGDGAATWRTEALSPADRRGFWRYAWLAVFKDRLYAFPYALTDVETEGKTRTLFTPDPMGKADVLMNDGGAWRSVDLVPDKGVIKVSPIVFGNRMLLSVVTGKVVPSYVESVFRDRKLPAGVRAKLFAFDGEKTTPIDFPHDFLVDSHVKDGCLALLVMRDRRYLLAETTDLVKWEILELAVGGGHALSIERIGETWYVGMKDGNLHRSIGIAPAGTSPQPDRFEILADLPREGVGPWAAIVSSLDATARARLLVSREGAKVTASATNVGEFRIFVGDTGLTGEATLVVDGAEVFSGKVGPDVALVGTRGESGWTVKSAAGSAATFTPVPQVVATAMVELKRAGDDPTIGLVVTDAIRVAAKADVALMNRGTLRKNLPAGPIHAADVLDLVYRNRIAVVKVRGEVLREMLAFNLEKGGRDRCQFAGFTAVWSKAAGLVQCSIDPEREYTVALPDYTAEHATDYFGRAVEFTSGDILVSTAIITWLREHPKLGEVKPRLTLSD